MIELRLALPDLHKTTNKDRADHSCRLPGNIGLTTSRSQTKSPHLAAFARCAGLSGAIRCAKTPPCERETPSGRKHQKYFPR